MQVSPSGMAAASQAVPGEFDSRHLLQKDKRPNGAFVFFETVRSSRLSFLAQSVVFFALGHRADGHMSALSSPLKSVINAFLYG